VALSYFECLGHAANDKRLTNRLMMADRQCYIFISLMAQGFGHEYLAGNTFHRGKNPAVSNAAPAQIQDQSNLS
jgi:hypothetical protein